MATVWTDFREYRRGSRPEDMLTAWGASLSAVVEGSAFDLPHRSSLRLSAPSGMPRSAIYWNAPSADVGYANQESQLLIRLVSPGSASHYPRLVLRGSGNSAATSNGYLLLVSTSHLTVANMTIIKLVNNVETGIAFAAKSFPLNTWIYLKFGINGTSLLGKSWAYGDTEPVAWDLGQVDATFASGWVGIESSNPGIVADVKYWSVGTAGESAPAFSAFDDPLDVWSMEPDEDVDISARFEFYNPASNSVESEWHARFPRQTRFNDYPSQTKIYGSLIDPGSMTSKVEADAHLGGAATVSRAPMRLDNKPTKNGALGPLSAWEGYRFFGRPVELRIGKRWAVKPSGTNPGIRSDHRRYELIGCGQATAEPEVGVPEASLNWGPMVVLTDKVEVRRFIGISTGIKSLSAAGWLRIPSHAAYDSNNFNIAFQISVPVTGVAGTGLCPLSQRQTDATHRQWSIALGQASHATLANKLQIDADTGAGVSLLSATSGSVALGVPIPVVLSIRGGDRWYCYVNGVKVGGGTIAGSPHGAIGQIVEVLRNAPLGVLLFDHRIERYLPEEVSKGRYLSRLDVDQYNISMHRCDDATLSTVTDFNTTTANHGTLQGVDGVDRIWYQTYMGVADQAGTPMPLAGGVVYHGPAKPTDGLRDIYRFTDGARTPGSSLAVKSQGLTLTPITNWIEPSGSEGAGTIDMVGSAAQPVTFSMPPAGTPDDSRIHLPQLLRDELVNRGQLGAANANLDSFAALRTLLPFKGGYCYQDPPTLGDFLTRGLSTILGFHCEERHGRLFAGSFLPPLNPGPYGQEPMLEFTGIPNRGVTFSSNSAFDLNNQLTSGVPLWGLAAWVKFPRTGWMDGSATLGTYFPSGMTIIDRVSGAAGYYLGIDGRTGSIVYGAPGVVSATTGLHFLSYNYLFEAGKTYFIFCTQDFNTRTICVASSTDPGLAVTTEASELTTGALTVPASAPLLIGHGPRGSFYGYIGYVIGSSAGLAIPNFTIPYNVRTSRFTQANVSAGSWTQARFIINLTEGRGDTAAETKTGLVGRIEGARWCPRLTLDLRKRAVLEGQPPRNTVPIWRAEAHYRTSYQILKGSDVAGGVSAAERIALGQQWLAEPDSSQDVRTNYRGSKDAILESLLYSGLDADAVSSMLRSRVAPGRKFGDVANCDRSALRLNPSDEILLYANTASFQSGRPLRVYSLYHLVGMLRSSIGGWG